MRNTHKQAQNLREAAVRFSATGVTGCDRTIASSISWRFERISVTDGGSCTTQQQENHTNDQRNKSKPPPKCMSTNARRRGWEIVVRMLLRCCLSGFCWVRDLVDVVDQYWVKYQKRNFIKNTTMPLQLITNTTEIKITISLIIRKYVHINLDCWNSAAMLKLNISITLCDW